MGCLIAARYADTRQQPEPHAVSPGLPQRGVLPGPVIESR
jgi:hypothetical protein